MKTIIEVLLKKHLFSLMEDRTSSPLAVIHIKVYARITWSILFDFWCF